MEVFFLRVRCNYSYHLFFLYYFTIIIIVIVIVIIIIFLCPEVLRSPRDLDIINLVGVLSGWSGLVVHRRGEGTGEGHKIVSLDCY